MRDPAAAGSSAAGSSSNAASSSFFPDPLKRSAPLWGWGSSDSPEMMDEDDPEAIAEGYREALAEAEVAHDLLIAELAAVEAAWKDEHGARSPPSFFFLTVRSPWVVHHPAPR